MFFWVLCVLCVFFWIFGFLCMCGGGGGLLYFIFGVTFGEVITKEVSNDSKGVFIYDVTWIN